MAVVSDVQRTLRVGLEEGSEPTPMSACEFQAAVREGKIQGKTPVWGRIFTNGEWQTAADLRIFHAASPTPVPLGPYLQSLEDAKAQAAREGEELRHEYSEYVSSYVSTARRRLDVSQAEAVWIVRGTLPGFVPQYLVVEDRGTVLDVERYVFEHISHPTKEWLIRKDYATIAHSSLSPLARERRLLEKLLESPPSSPARNVRGRGAYSLEYCSRQLSTVQIIWYIASASQSREAQLTAVFTEVATLALGSDDGHNHSSR